MDISSLGLDISVLFSIVGMSEIIKTFDVNKRYKKYYVFIPLFLSICISFFLTKPFDWLSLGKNAFVYTGISSYAYNLIKNQYKKLIS